MQLLVSAPMHQKIVETRHHHIHKLDGENISKKVFVQISNTYTVIYQFALSSVRALQSYRNKVELTCKKVNNKEH